MSKKSHSNKQVVKDNVSYKSVNSREMTLTIIILVILKQTEQYYPMERQRTKISLNTSDFFLSRFLAETDDFRRLLLRGDCLPLPMTPRQLLAPQKHLVASRLDTCTQTHRTSSHHPNSQNAEASSSYAKFICQC